MLSLFPRVKSEMKMPWNRDREWKVKWKCPEIEIEKWNWKKILENSRETRLSQGTGWLTMVLKVIDKFLLWKETDHWCLQLVLVCSGSGRRVWLPSEKTILSEVFRSLLTCFDAFPGGLEALKEVEIFEADNFVLRMTQTYAHRFQCNFDLALYLFDTQVICLGRCLNNHW